MKWILNNLNQKLYWTKHCREKMQYYRLSENRLKRILRHSDRMEEGIAPSTVAVMQRTGKTEIWLMYQNFKTKKSQGIRIITAWRYPGKSPQGKEIPIPLDIQKTIKAYLKN